MLKMYKIYIVSFSASTQQQNLVPRARPRRECLSKSSLRESPVTIFLSVRALLDPLREDGGAEGSLLSDARTVYVAYLIVLGH